MDILHPTVKLGDKEQIGDKSRDPHPSLSVHVVIECPPFPHPWNAFQGEVEPVHYGHTSLKSSTYIYTTNFSLINQFWYFNFFLPQQYRRIHSTYLLTYFLPSL